MKFHRRALLNTALPIFLAFSALFLFVQFAESAVLVTNSKTNATAGQADGSLITRTVSFGVADFGPGATINQVLISVDFEKIDGQDCSTGHQGGSAFNNEIYMILESPSGTQVVLIEDAANSGGSGSGATYTGSSYGGSVAVNFDPSAGSQVGGLIPTSGTYRAEQSLGAFTGENPTGDWILHFGDSLSNDALCFDQYTLTIDASEAPNIDNQSFNVDENASVGAAVGTVAATDNDPDDKISYAIDAISPANHFAINPLTGQLTVSGALDYETYSVYTLTVRVTDSSGLTDTATVNIIVDFVNVAPELQNFTVSPATINENETITLTADIVDPNPSDTFTVTVSWGDGSSDDVVNYGATGTFTLTHQYLDDDPSGTPSDNYLVEAVVEDASAAQDMDGAIVTVNNVAPVLSGLAVSPSTPITETGSVTVTGNIADVGTLDMLSLQVSWGDGTPPQNVDVTGQSTFTLTHQYNDDNPTGTASDNNTIGFVLSDDDGGFDTDSLMVTVNNQPPTLSLNPLSSRGVLTINEGDNATLSGTISDISPLDPFNLNIDWGDGIVENIPYPAGSTLFTETHQFVDDSSGSVFTVTATLSDDDTGQVSASDTLMVDNVDPTLSNISATNVNENGTTTLTATLTDPGTADTFSVTIDWGDGVTETVAYPAGSTTISENHQYLDDNPTATSADNYTISVTVEDDDGGSDSDTTSVTVSNVNPVVEAGTNLSLSKGNPVANFTGSFTDVGTLDTHTIHWDFGDGNSAAGTLTPSHTYSAGVSATYVVTLTVTDDDTGTHFDTLTVTVGNSGPTAVDDEYTTDEDTALNVPAAGILTNDDDPDSDPLTIVSSDTSSVLGAAVTVNADGSFGYDPTAVATFQNLGTGAILTDTFSYTIEDTDGLPSTATVFVGVNGINDNPVANDDAGSTTNSSTANIPVLDNDTDREGDTLTVIGLGSPANGSAFTDGTTVTYTPTVSFEGTDVFTYTIGDGFGGRSTATITMTVTGMKQIFIPAVMNGYTPAPDLVVTSISGQSDNIEVTIENQGDQITTGSFWVDLYINPTTAPAGANDFWQDLSTEGLVWLVTASINPGESLTLVYSSAPAAPNTYYAAEFSSYSDTLTAGTPLYAQVDSAHIGTTFGGILETHEIFGTSYNNISGPVLAN